MRKGLNVLKLLPNYTFLHLLVPTILLYLKRFQCVQSTVFCSTIAPIDTVMDHNHITSFYTLSRFSFLVFTKMNMSIIS